MDFVVGRLEGKLVRNSRPPRAQSVVKFELVTTVAGWRAIFGPVGNSWSCCSDIGISGTKSRDTFPARTYSCSHVRTIEVYVNKGINISEVEVLRRIRMTYLV